MTRREQLNAFAEQARQSNHNEETNMNQPNQQDGRELPRGAGVIDLGMVMPGATQQQQTYTSPISGLVTPPTEEEIREQTEADKFQAAHDAAIRKREMKAELEGMWNIFGPKPEYDDQGNRKPRPSLKDLFF